MHRNPSSRLMTSLAWKATRNSRCSLMRWMLCSLARSTSHSYGTLIRSSPASAACPARAPHARLVRPCRRYTPPLRAGPSKRRAATPAPSSRVGTPGEKCGILQGLEMMSLLNRKHGLLGSGAKKTPAPHGYRGNKSPVGLAPVRRTPWKLDLTFGAQTLGKTSERPK